MNSPVFASFALTLAALVSAGCHSRPPKPRPAVTGTLNYDNFVVTPGCTIEVRLDDVSRADAPAINLARQLIDSRESSPIPFKLHYEPSSIDPGHRYVVAAKISCSGELRMISDTAHPVLTQGNPVTVVVVLKPVAR